MAHDGSEGLSPDGWLPDRISVGVLARVFPPELVDAAVDAAGAREQRRRLLPARLVMYFVLALWLFRGRNCGYGQVMTKLADGLYHQRRAGDQLAGQELDPGGWVDAGGGRRWKPPNISSLSRGRGNPAVRVQLLVQQVTGTPLVIQPVGQLGHPLPGPAVPAAEQPQGQREVHHQPRRQQPAPLLPGPGRVHRRIHQLRRENPGQDTNRDPVRQPAVRRQPFRTIMRHETVTIPRQTLKQGH